MLALIAVLKIYESLCVEMTSAHNTVSDENLPLVVNSGKDDNLSTQTTSLEEVAVEENFDMAENEKNYSTKGDKILSEAHEKALCLIGTGPYHYLLTLVLGVAYIGDLVELYSLSFILISAQQEMCMDNTMKGVLASSTFVGMMIGSVVIGNISDKKGRKAGIVTSLILNVVFGILAALSPYYWMLLSCRLLAGIGIGGVASVVLAVIGEFCPLQKRVKYFTAVLVCWSSGAMFVAVLALVVLGPKEEHITSTNWHFSRWRLFMLLCPVPCMLALICSIFTHESPRYLLDVGKFDEALNVYQCMFKWNNRDKVLPEFYLPKKKVKMNPGKVQPAITRALQNTKELLSPRFARYSIIIALLWIGNCIGAYGMIVWFVEYLNRLEIQEMKLSRIHIINQSFDRAFFNGTIENLEYIGCTFKNSVFEDVKFDSVSFVGSNFTRCTFENIQSLLTDFIDCSFVETIFNKTDLYKYKFSSSTFHQTQLHEDKNQCHVPFKQSSHQETILIDNLISQSALVPGVLLSLPVIKCIGRRYAIVVSLLLCSICVFFIWLVNTRTSTVALQTIFGGLVYFAWNPLEILTTELFPTHLRSSALGISGVGRLGAVLANFVFAEFIDLSKAVPVLFTSLVMTLSGVCALFLPESQDWIM